MGVAKLGRERRGGRRGSDGGEKLGGNGGRAGLV